MNYADSRFTGYDDSFVQTCPSCDTDTMVSYDKGKITTCNECGYSIEN